MGLRRLIAEVLPRKIHRRENFAGFTLKVCLCVFFFNILVQIILVLKVIVTSHYALKQYFRKEARK